ncbi:hypothetical protein U1Q18_030952 [Sarracenia purpurea var. burkii]
MGVLNVSLSELNKCALRGYLMVVVIHALAVFPQSLLRCVDVHCQATVPMCLFDVMFRFWLISPHSVSWVGAVYGCNGCLGVLIVLLSDG